MMKLISGWNPNEINGLGSSCNVFVGRGSQHPSPTPLERIHNTLKKV